MAQFINRCIWNAVSTGLGDFVVGSAANNGYTPAQCLVPTTTTGATYHYFATNGIEHEEGDGVYTVATTTLARTTIRNSSNAAAKVNFSMVPVVIMGGPVANDMTGFVVGGTAGQVQYNVAGTSFGGFTVGGDATLVTSTGVLTIANDAVTYAKMQNISAASLLLGRGSAAGAGDPQEIILGTNLTMSGTTLNATGGASALTVGTTTIASGATTKVLFDNVGVLGEYTISGSGNVAMTTSPTFTTPVLGTPTSGTLTNCTGYTVANLSGAGAGVLTFLATPSSANLISAVTDETGTGALVFANTPTLVTPILGVATGTSLALNGATLGTAKLAVTGSVALTPFALTDGATPALDASQGMIFTLAAAGDRTIAVPSNASLGQKIIIRHLASGGARTLALNTGANGFRFGSDITGLTLTASGKKDYIGCIWNDTDSFWDVVAYVKGY